MCDEQDVGRQVWPPPKRQAAKYEDGTVAQIGDAGIFTYGDNEGGYQYEGIVTSISETGRLEIRTPAGYPVTLIMAAQVKFTMPA